MEGSHVLEHNHIACGVFMGSAPLHPELVVRGSFSAVVLCAEEYQPDSKAFHGVQVVRAGIDDGILSNREMDIATNAAREIQPILRSGRNVLITCMEGRNRSGLVAGLAIHILTGWSGETCAKLIRRNRHPLNGGKPLTNSYFMAALMKLRERPQGKTA